MGANREKERCRAELGHDLASQRAAGGKKEQSSPFAESRLHPFTRARIEGRGSAHAALRAREHLHGTSIFLYLSSFARLETPFSARPWRRENAEMQTFARTCVLTQRKRGLGQWLSAAAAAMGSISTFRC